MENGTSNLLFVTEFKMIKFGNQEQVVLEPSSSSQDREEAKKRIVESLKSRGWHLANIASNRRDGNYIIEIQSDLFNTLRDQGRCTIT